MTPGSVLSGLLLSSRPSYELLHSSPLLFTPTAHCSPPLVPFPSLDSLEREPEGLPLSSQEAPGQVQMALLGSGVCTCVWLLWSDRSTIS